MPLPAPSYRDSPAHGGRITDPYEVLEVEPHAPDEVIKKAYRKLAMRYHPDRNPDDPTAEARFKEIAAAWEVLSDPAQRAQLDGTRAKTLRGELPDDFLDDVENAVDRAWSWVERGVVPHYAQFWRGIGAEMSARLVADIDKLADTSVLKPEVTWWRKRRADKLLARLDIELYPWPSNSISGLAIGKRWTLRISPHALWNLGYRDSSEIDDAVMRIMLLQAARVVSIGRISPPPETDNPAHWAGWIDAARAMDDTVQLNQRMWAAGYALFGGLIFLMLYSGYTA